VLREIIIPNNEHYDLHIPKEYINRSVEILVFPVDDDYDEDKNIVLAQKSSMQDWDNEDDEVWNDISAV